MIICGNLFKFTLYTIIIYKVGDTRCHLRDAICCYPIAAILACLFSVGVRISGKKLQLNEGMAAKMASRVSYLVYYYCV